MIDASKSRKILDPPVMIPSEAPTDNVWNAGVVTDCWRFCLLYLFASCYYRALSMNLHSTINSPLSVIEKKKHLQ